MGVTEVLDVDLLDPSLYRNGMPHELYAELREVGPVLWRQRTQVPSYGRDIEFAGRCSVIARSSRPIATGSVFRPRWHHDRAISAGAQRRHVRNEGPTGVQPDPAAHQRWLHTPNGRAPRGANPGASRADPRRCRGAGELDFVPDIAYQLPMHVIADIVGIPELDRPEVFRLTDLIMRATDPFQEIAADEQRNAEAALFTYAHELSAEKRRNPTDDVWSILAAGELDEFELDLFFMALTFGGSETTRNALAQGLMALLDHRDQMAELRENPTLLPAAAEEVLRWSSPVICFGRTVTRDIELGAQQLRAGDRVGLFTRRRIATKTCSPIPSASTSTDHQIRTLRLAAAGHTSASAQASPAPNYR